jgi:hypothetical protein
MIIMITIKWKQVVFAGLTILTLAACKKDLLDQAPELDLDQQKVFADINLAEKFVNNIYGGLPNGYWPNVTGTYAIEGTITDEADQSYQWTGAELWTKGGWNPTSGAISGEWNRYYSSIRKTNIVLENVENAQDLNPQDELTVNRLKGEALFLRAFFHFELAKRFGGIPVIVKVLSPNEDLVEANTRKPFSEVVAQVAKDCEEAAALLPNKYNSSSLTGRATKGACMALKARALLYLASPLHNGSNDANLWQNAATAAKAVIDMGGFNLYSPYAEVFTKTNNSEIIFARQAGDDNFWDVCNTPPGSRYGGWGGTSPTQNFVDNYEMNNGKSITDPTSGYNASNPYANRDPRFYATILYNGAPWAGLNVETNVGGAEGLGAGDYTRTGYYLKKFVWEGAVSSGFNDPAFHNWPFFRLGEMYLNYAEALNESTGPVTEVYNAVNAVRLRADMPELPIGLSKEEMRLRIRNERAIELAFEEHRFWDVRRWKIAESTVGVPIKGMRITGTAPNWVYTPFDVEPRVFEAKMYLYPVPQAEINKNLGLTQNPGW